MEFLTQQQSLVSVVIPAYRVTAYIAAAIDSVLAQTFPDFEIIVVNDACPDSVALERALEPYLDRIRYFRQEKNAGPSATRNTGIRAARGDFIAFLDGDDLYEPGYLAVQLGMLRENPEADMVYGRALIMGDDPCVGMPVDHFAPSRGPVTVASLLRQEVTVQIMALARREVLFRAGLFDEQIRKCEDYDLWLRMAKAGGRIIYHSIAVARYRVRGDSASADSVDMNRYRMMVADKVERTMTLNDDEKEALAGARLRWTSETALEQARSSFAQKNYREAGKYLLVANRYLKRPKLAFAGTALRHMPGLVRVAAAVGGYLRKAPRAKKAA